MVRKTNKELRETIETGKVICIALLIVIVVSIGLSIISYTGQSEIIDMQDELLEDMYDLILKQNSLIDEYDAFAIECSVKLMEQEQLLNDYNGME
jgi:hypothetical protein